MIFVYLVSKKENKLCQEAFIESHIHIHKNKKKKKKIRHTFTKMHKKEIYSVLNCEI